MSEQDRAAIEAFHRAVRASKAGRAKRRRNPGQVQRLDQVMKDVVADLGWQEATAGANTIARWPELVGPEIADHVRAVRMEGSTLVVQAESTAWANQMRLLLSQVHERLDEALGEGTVQEITVLGPAAPSWVRGPRRVPGRGPRDTYG
jgi:predicted nucleic acid-binding Zn ribbon protein